MFALRFRVTARRAAVGGALLALAATGCTSGGGDAEPEATTTSLSEIDTSELVVSREAFCDDLDTGAIEAALGGEVGDEAPYGNGEVVTLDTPAGAVEDRVHEFGCRFYDGSADEPAGTLASAWVFVPPVTPESAQSYVDAAAATEGCETLPDADAFGSPTLAQRCVTAATSADGTALTRTEVSYRGLFGDAWLGCSLRTIAATEADSPASGTTSESASEATETASADTSPAADDLAERASTWCAQVALAAAD